MISATGLLLACSGQVSGPLGAFGTSSSTEPGDPTSPGGKDGNDDGIGMSNSPLDCSQPHVGYTPLQRLSRSQYGHAVRDLLGVEFDIADLPEDEKVGVFQGNTVATVTDLLVDEYATAATSAAKAAQDRLEQLVPCDRAGQGDDACAAQFIEKFGRRAYRRPLSQEEQDAYVAQYGEFKGNGYAEALRVVVQTMLQSPNMLYRVELQPTAPGDMRNTKLDAYELASRLSFFLLDTVPDDALLEAAAMGELDADGLDAQVDRLIQDPRFADTLESFHANWLDLTKAKSMTKSGELFPGFSAELASAMYEDTMKFVKYVYTEDDARLDTLLTGAFAFPDENLAKLYGVSASADGKPVELNPEERAGVLLQPAFLATHSHYDQSSPVERGKIVIRNVLCQVLPDPPPNVNTTPPDPGSNVTQREFLKVHQEDPSCAGCHKRIDGIGLGFEQFDAIGAFRTMEAGKPVDSSGEILSSGDANGAFTNSVEMVEKLAGSAAVQECVATQWLRFALGRLEAGDDECTLAKLFQDFAGSEHDLRVLLKSIVKSDAFLMKRVSPQVTP